MTTPLQLLIHSLIGRGVFPDHIPALVRNVLEIIGDGGMFTTKLVNGELEQLGWGSVVLDETCFQLIVYILESEWGYRVRHYDPGSLQTGAIANLRSWSSCALSPNNNEN
jgi:hypothetical protein